MAFKFYTWSCRALCWPQTVALSAEGRSLLKTIKFSFMADVNDDSEFPSLSGAPQSQQQTSQSQAIWGHPGARSGQHAPVQRPHNQNQNQNQSQTNASHSNEIPSQIAQSQQQQGVVQQPENHNSLFPHLGTGLDDYRFGGHSSVDEGARTQEQHGNIDEFPPLGGLGGVDIGQGRRNGFEQGSQFNGTAGNTFGRISTQQRSGVLGQSSAHMDGLGSAERMMSPTAITSGGVPALFSSIGAICLLSHLQPRQHQDRLWMYHN